MRTIKELLQLMLDNKSFFQSGLCLWSTELKVKGKITEQEYCLLKGYILDNRPGRFSSIDAFKHYNHPFYWKVCNIKPRIKWLEKHVAKNS